jgi:hypothetical protein
MARTSSSALKPEMAIQKIGKNITSAPAAAKTRLAVLERNVRNRTLASKAAGLGRAFTAGKGWERSLWVMSLFLAIGSPA